MNVRRTLAATAAVLLPLVGVGVPAPVVAQSQVYTVDSTHTFPSFEISHLGFSTQRGRFNMTSGKVILDPAARTGSIEISIDTYSIDTGLEALEKVLREPEWFNVAQFPAMTFRSERLRFDGERLVGVDGNLTLRGVTRPVSLQVEHFRCAMHPLRKKPACGADASTTVKRSEFGMVKFPAPIVGEDVRIAIQIEAIQD